MGNTQARCNIESENGSDIWDDTALIEAYDNAVSVMQKQLSGHGVEICQNPVKEGKEKGKTNQKRKRKKKSKNKNDRKSEATSNWRVGHHCRAVFTEDGEIYEAVIKSLDLANNSALVRFLGYGNEEEQDLDDLLPSEAMSMPQRRMSQTSDVYSELSQSDAGSEGLQTWPQPQQQQQPPARQQRRGSTASSRGRGGRGPSPGVTGPPPHPPPMMSWGGPPLPPPPPPSFSQSWSAQPPFNPLHSLVGGGPPLIPPMFSSPDFLNPSFPSSMGLPVLPPPPVSETEDLHQDREALHNMLISWYMSGYNTGYYQGLKDGRQKKQSSQSAQSCERNDSESNTRKT